MWGRVGWAGFGAAAALMTGTVAVGAPPVPAAPAWILMNPATGEVLAARNPDRPLPMASTTKMMTALLAAERASPDRIVTVPVAATLVGESTARLVAGERISIGALIAATLVASGNDAAVSLAQAVAGSQPAFVRMMNRRAVEMGLTHTHFANPHGLDAPGHHASVRDLATLGNAVMAEPRLRALVGRRSVTIAGPGGVGRRVLVSHNTLLDLDPDADGIKTGQTDGAGYALAAHATRPALGVALTAALIGSPSEQQRARDARMLLDWGFRQYARSELVRPGTPLVRVAVRDRPGVRLLLRAGAEPLDATIRLGHRMTESIEVPAEVFTPVHRGQVVGRLVIRQDGRVLGTRPLVADRDVAAPTLVQRLRAGLDALLP